MKYPKTGNLRLLLKESKHHHEIFFFSWKIVNTRPIEMFSVPEQSF